MFTTGPSVILLQLRLDLDKGVYIYDEQRSFSLPTSYETYAHMDISLEPMHGFKVIADIYTIAVIKIAGNNYYLLAKNYRFFSKP